MPEHLSAGRAYVVLVVTVAIFVDLQPAIGVGLAWSILGETLGAWQIAGGVFGLAGVVLTGSGQRTAADRSLAGGEG